MVLVYDVTNRHSFLSVEQRWLDQVDKYCNRGAKHCVVMLLGNKIDLVAQSPSAREVPVEEAMALAQHKGMIFAECSSKEDIGLRDAMQVLADRLVEVYHQESATPSTAVSLDNYPTSDEDRGGCGC